MLKENCPLFLIRNYLRIKLWVKSKIQHYFFYSAVGYSFKFEIVIMIFNKSCCTCTIFSISKEHFILKGGHFSTIHIEVEEILY